MGAWIEIPKSQLVFVSGTVAPYMGAWIEIYRSCNCRPSIIGRSLHGSVD